ncbi:MAG: transposase [Roseobacter sp.]
MTKPKRYKRFSSEFKREAIMRASEEGMTDKAVCDELGIAADAVVHSVAHRWRFAKVVQPLGRHFVRNADATIYAGGDWCLGARVEAAWMSGDAIARDILEAA